MEETLNTSVYNEAQLKYLKNVWKGSKIIIFASTVVILLIYLGFGIFGGLWKDWVYCCPPPVLCCINYAVMHRLYKKASLKKKRAIIALYVSLITMILSVFFIRLNFLAFLFVFPIVCVAPLGKRTVFQTYIWDGIIGTSIYLAHQFILHHLGLGYANIENCILMYLLAQLLNLAAFIFAIQTSDIIKNVALKTEEYARQSEKNYHKATHDSLTGAYNREKIKIDLVKYNFVSCAFVDMDDFSHFNNDYGHEVGDDVLKALVACIEAELGNKGRVYRYGGDEFTVLAYVSKEAVKEVLEQASMDFKSKIWLQHKISGSFSAGIIDWDPNQSSSMNIHRADELMYKVKENGKNSILLG